jgi:hypothetical protein
MTRAAVVLAAPPDGAPCIEPLAVREPGVQHGDLVAEGRAESIHGLRRERDLGDEHDGAAPLAGDAPEQLDVDQCLPAAGDAVQQEHASRRRRGHPLDGLPLRGGRLDGYRGGNGARREGIAHRWFPLDRHQSAALQRADHRGRDAEARFEVGNRGSSA